MTAQLNFIDDGDTSWKHMTPEEIRADLEAFIKWCNSMAAQPYVVHPYQVEALRAAFYNEPNVIVFDVATPSHLEPIPTHPRQMVIRTIDRLRAQDASRLRRARR